jgi:hypothetical protein
MKHLLLFSICLVMIILPCIPAQSQDSPSPKEKPHSQSDLYNEVYAGYGIGSIYYFKESIDHSYNISSTGTFSQIKSPGVFLFGYNRTLTRVVALGFVASYQQVNYNSLNQDQTTQNNYTDNLYSGIAQIRFTYVNKPVLRMYSSAGFGITVDLSEVSGPKGEDTERKVIPAGQIVLIGFRVGRALAGFGEFGFLTNGIINLGISYKFGD